MSDKQSETLLYLTLYEEVKNSILEGLLKPYTKLLSIRQRAQKENISKTTVERAYNQLAIEGYIKSYPKSGYYVLPIKKLPIKSPKEILKPLQEHKYTNTALPRDSFLYDGFKKAFLEVLHDQPEALYQPPLSKGETALKNALYEYLSLERGLKLSPDHIVISSGIQNHITQLATLTPSRKVGYLKPLYPNAKTLFHAHNFELIGFDCLHEMLESVLDFIYISPSNHYPRGEVLPFNDRMKLIDYAKKHKAYIIEDDYNYIYRYNAYQIPSIQGLALGSNVIYIGSLARLILPSLRISYMVLPETLLKYVNTQPLSQTVSVIDQLAVAKYISSSAFNKQLKKLSRFSKKQNDVIKHIVADFEKAPHFSIDGLDSNLHLVMTFKNEQDYHYARTLIKENHWTYTPLHEQTNTLVLPYHGFKEHDFSSLISLLQTLHKKSE